MQDHRRIWAAAIFAILGGGVVACVGGGGGLSGPLETGESPPTSIERAQDNRERAPSFLERAKLSAESSSRTGEPGPGAQGTGGVGAGTSGFDCSGTYVCQEVGKTKADTITLSQVNGVCTAEGVVIESDGRLTSKGKSVGTWSATPTGFTVVTEDTMTCTKSDSAPPGATETSSGTGTATRVDAG